MKKSSVMGLTSIAPSGRAYLELDAFASSNVNVLAGLAKQWDTQHGLLPDGGEGPHVEHEQDVYRASLQRCILPDSYLEPCIVSVLSTLIKPAMRLAKSSQ